MSIPKKIRSIDILMMLCLLLVVTGCGKNSNKEKAKDSQAIAQEEITPSAQATVKQEGSKQVAASEPQDTTAILSQTDSKMQEKLQTGEESIKLLGSYKKTLNSYFVDSVSKDGKNQELVQLIWQCEGEDNSGEFEWYTGHEWLINVWMNQGEVQDYQVQPCIYSAMKTAIGTAKLMENGKDAVKLAYNTYLDDSTKASIVLDDFSNEWTNLVSELGAFQQVNYIYYGYHQTYDYPYAVISWGHEKGSVRYQIQLTAATGKIIGKTASSDQGKPVSYEDVITQQEAEVTNQTYSLKDIYKDDFYFGCATPANLYERWDELGDTLTTNFNSVTMENEMKPDSVLDKEKCIKGVSKDSTYIAVKYNQCDEAIKKLRENHIKLRYHTLAWHSQTPAWFFHEGYDETKPLVDKETMMKRMENFIHAVIEYCDQEYSDLIYAIDVVNEAFNGNGTLGIKTDDNLWYDTIGYEYVYYAFKYTREAVNASKNMKDVTLVYNDYSMNQKTDTVMKGLDTLFSEKGEQVHDYVDAIGFQAHYDTVTSMAQVADAAKKFCDAGYEVQFTELDIGIPEIKHGGQPTKEQLKLQGEKFKSLLQRLKAMKEEGCNITSVTVWGIKDTMSWRQNSNGYDSFATLLNDDLSYKPAFLGAALDPSVLSYYELGIDY